MSDAGIGGARTRTLTGLRLVYYGLLVSSWAEDWLKAQWALRPTPCNDCRKPRSVVYTEWHATRKESAGHQWGLLCWHCHPPESVSSWLADALNWLIIGECRSRPLRLLEVGERVPKERVVVWHRPGTELDLEHLADTLRGLERLAWAREMDARKPGPWQLQLRDDGQLWAPWCPVSRLRDGPALPYRKSVLRASRSRRRCVACNARVEAGETVWRPYKAGGTVHACGWPSDAYQTAIVCQRCVDQFRGQQKPMIAAATHGPLHLVRDEQDLGAPAGKDDEATT